MGLGERLQNGKERKRKRVRKVEVEKTERGGERGGGDKPACYLITTINAHPLAPNIILGGGGASPPPAPATRQPPTKHDRLIYGPTSDTLGPADYLLVLLHPKGIFAATLARKPRPGGRSHERSGAICAAEAQRLQGPSSRMR